MSTVLKIKKNDYSLPEKVGSGGRGGKGGKSKNGRTDRNSDVRRGRSHRSNSVRGVGCEEQEKTWMVVLGTNPQEGQRGLGTSPILSR